jgi:hypothetical protein
MDIYVITLIIVSTALALIAAGFVLGAVYLDSQRR